MVISKKHMGVKAKQAAQQAPSFEDRLSLVDSAAHPNNTKPEPAPIHNIVQINPQVNFSEGATDEARPLHAPVELIDTNPFNARHIYKPERVAKLASSIAAHGQEVPGIATYRGGRIILAAGHYRLRAIKQLGLPTMMLMVHDNLSDRDLYEMSYRENAERESQTSLDNALAWKLLLEKNVYKSETDIAEATGMSLPNVNKTMAVFRLSNDTLEVLKQQPTQFALSSIYELVLFEEATDAASGTKMAKRILEGDIGRADIHDARVKLQNGKDRKRKETSRQYPIAIEGKKAGVLKEWDSNKVSFEVLLETPDQRHELVSLLKSKFKIA